MGRDREGAQLSADLLGGRPQPAGDHKSVRHTFGQTHPSENAASVSLKHRQGRCVEGGGEVRPGRPTSQRSANRGAWTCTPTGMPLPRPGRHHQGRGAAAVGHRYSPR